MKVNIWLFLEHIEFLYRIVFNKELQSISQDIQQDLPEPEEQGPGLMAKKPMEEMEQSEEMVNPQLEGAM